MNHIRQSGWGEKACYGGQESDPKHSHMDGYVPIYKFITMCSWCGACISVKADPLLKEDETSHGACELCSKIMNDKLDESLKQANDISKGITK